MSSPYFGRNGKASVACWPSREVPALPGVLCYGHDRDQAVAGVQALALRVIAERLENREAPAEFINVTFQAA